MTIRPPHPDDQDNAQKAYELLIETIQANSYIEPTLWASAVVSLLIDGYHDSGINYEQFCESMDEIKAHFRKSFE
jgi:hypothetical protein